MIRTENEYSMNIHLAYNEYLFAKGVDPAQTFDLARRTADVQGLPPAQARIITTPFSRHARTLAGGVAEHPPRTRQG